MLSPAGLLVLATQFCALCRATYTRDWIEGLDECWRECLDDVGDGCDSQDCICEASCESNSFLPKAVSCAVSECDAGSYALDMKFLSPLERYCGRSDDPVPDSVMSSAYAAATATADASHSTEQRPSTDSEHKTTGGGDTETKTTSTENITGAPTSPTSAAASSDHASEGPAPVQTQSNPAPAPAPPASEEQESEEESNSNGNGSLFENMQAGASSWTFSLPLTALAFFAGIHLRL